MRARRPRRSSSAPANRASSPPGVPPSASPPGADSEPPISCKECVHNGSTRLNAAQWKQCSSASSVQLPLLPKNSVPTSGWSGTIVAAFRSLRFGHTGSRPARQRPWNLAGICDTPSPTVSAASAITLPAGPRVRGRAGEAVRGQGGIWWFDCPCEPPPAGAGAPCVLGGWVRSYGRRTNASLPGPLQRYCRQRARCCRLVDRRR